MGSKLCTSLHDNTTRPCPSFTAGRHGARGHPSRALTSKACQTSYHLPMIASSPMRGKVTRKHCLVYPASWPKSSDAPCARQSWPLINQVHHGPIPVQDPESVRAPERLVPRWACGVCQFAICPPDDSVAPAWRLLHPNHPFNIYRGGAPIQSRCSGRI